jgi:hypothetical protein
MSAGFAPPPLADVGEESLGYYANFGTGYVRQGAGGDAPPRTGAFLHGLHNASTGQRLVGLVFLERQDSPVGERRLEINALVWRPATREPDSRLQLAGLTTLVAPAIDRHRVRIYSGRTDPLNPAHFTVPYEIDGHPGTIDGWLDSYDRVQLQYRDGPGIDLTQATP